MKTVNSDDINRVIENVKSLANAQTAHLLASRQDVLGVFEQDIAEAILRDYVTVDVPAEYTREGQAITLRLFPAIQGSAADAEGITRSPLRHDPRRNRGF